MNLKTKMILCMIIWAAIGHGMVAAYFFAKAGKEPVGLDILWKVAALGGVYASFSFVTAALLYFGKAWR